MDRKVVKSKFFFEENFIETVSEVSTNKYQPWPDNDDLKVVGKPVNRVDAYDKVSGAAKYTFDRNLDRMVYVRILRSPHANAKIKSVNTDKARKLKGVLHIMTHKNAPDIGWWGDTTKLFDTHLRYEGDEVAAVAAVSEDTAERALHLIEVEYETLPHVVDPKEAAEPDAPKVHEDGNLKGGEPGVYNRGDVEAGMSEADIIHEEEFATSVCIHHPTEVMCSVVNWDGDKLLIYDSTQGVYRVRDSVAEVLEMPAADVRVIKKYMGGGFGSKLEQGKFTVMAALIARKLGRPVKVTVDRKEMALSQGNRPDSYQHIKMGIKKDGTITAADYESFGSMGAYRAGASSGKWPMRLMYDIPNLKIVDNELFTNAGRARPFRAPGYPQGFFAMDQMMDIMAEKAGMDTLDFMMKNYTETEPNWDNPYTSKLLKECYKAGAEAIGWKENRKPAGSGTGRYKTGYGVASQIWWGSGGPPTYCYAKLNSDGSLNLSSGSQDLGTGTYTFMTQIAAEVLEIPMEQIDVNLGDTDTGPYAHSSGGSTTAPSLSPAVRDACEQIKQRIIESAAATMEVPESRLSYSEGAVTDKNDSEKKMSISEIMGEMRLGTISVTGAREQNAEGYNAFSFGAQFANVEVDTETGKVKVKKIVAAHDIGRVLNRKTLENQFHGGIIQSLSLALMEGRVMDAYTGKMVNANFYDYKVPTMMDIPEMEIVIVSDGDPLISNTGVKGIGEPAIIPGAAAIANAVYNAIGVRVKSAPITPDKVLNALMDAGKV